MSLGAVLVCRRILCSMAVLPRCLHTGRELSASAQKMWIRPSPEAAAGSTLCALQAEQGVTAVPMSTVLLRFACWC